MARPGQHPQALIESLDLALLVEFSYAIITEHMDSKAKAEFDAKLAELSDPEAQKVHLVRNFKGETVAVTQARLDEIRARAGRVEAMTAKGGRHG